MGETIDFPRELAQRQDRSDAPAGVLVEVPHHLVELVLRDLPARVPLEDDRARAPAPSVAPTVAPPIAPPGPEEPSERPEQNEDPQEGPEPEERKPRPVWSLRRSEGAVDQTHDNPDADQRQKDPDGDPQPDPRGPARVRAHTPFQITSALLLCVRPESRITRPPRGGSVEEPRGASAPAPGGQRNRCATRARHSGGATEISPRPVS